MKLSDHHEDSNKKLKKKLTSLAQRIQIWKSTAWKICRDAAEQSILERWTRELLQFPTEYGMPLKISPGVLNVTRFSDVVHLHFDSYIHIQLLLAGRLVERAELNLPLNCNKRKWKCQAWRNLELRWKNREYYLRLKVKKIIFGIRKRRFSNESNYGQFCF